MEAAMNLSPSALLVLRFRANNWPLKHPRPDAYRELVDAGIMSADGEDFTFTEDGWARREEYIAEAEENIERERFEPPDGSNLSPAARDLLRQITAGRVEVTLENRPAFRELMSARIIMLGHSFRDGRDSVYRWTYYGYKQRFELSACAKDAG
jgi:hypothetical protein